jgi:archaea-specific DNA-binding protein
MEKTEENIIKIGNKNFIQYIRSIELLMKKKNKKKIVLKARGKNIGKAVDLAEASKNKFLKEMNISIENIKTATESFEKDGEERFVSCISIDLVKRS